MLGSPALDGLRYGKVCTPTACTSRHSKCALFLRRFHALVEKGRVHVAMPPLFRVDIGEQEFGFLCEEMRDLLAD
ncbi:MAG: hypothetical protein PHQ14_08145 [Chromatiales bacterium]|nr:hypothetical protein [Chromatiales bacterium]